MALAKRYADQLKRIKDKIEESHEDFRLNRDRYQKSFDFTFNTSISTDDKAVLIATKKPQIECNTVEAHISRLCGEYAKSEPSLNVTSADDAQVDPQLTSFLDGHFRWMLYEANNDGFQYNTYREQLGGGFSAMEVCTDYESEKSFDQVLRFKKPDDVTFVGFDPLARKPHKGDGSFWFKLYPKTKEDFEAEYPDETIDEISFTRGIGGFDWSYTTIKNQKILLMGEYFEKKKRKAKLIKLANNNSMLEDEYEEFTAQWNEAIQRGLTLQQPPAIVATRKTEVTTVCRYVIIEDRVLEYEETDYPTLNGVFVDGNSVWLKGTSNGVSKQMTRPYGWHAQGVQRLKNFSMQSLANELENLIQHKVIMPIEGLPVQEEYREVYTNYQVPNVMMYNAYYDKKTEKPLPPPQLVVRPPIPPEILQTFQICDQAMQMVLGSYDTAMGINDNQLSGKAIIAGATQSNAAAMPYIVNNLQALNQLGQIVVDLIPKYYKTPRSLPVIDKQGNRSSVKVNTKGGVNLSYDSSKLHVRVEAGVNFAVQKQQSLQQITALSAAEQTFAQFINTMCLDVLVDNLEIRGADILKERAQTFMKMMQKQQAQAANQPNPIAMKMQVEQQKNQIQAQDNQMDAAFRAQEIQNDRDANSNNTLEILLQAEAEKRKDVVQLARDQAEDMRSASLADKDHSVKVHDQMLKHVDQMHQHGMDKVNLLHDINTTQQELALQKQSNQQPTGETKNG